MKRPFSRLKLDIEIDQVPTLVNENHVRKHDLTIKAKVIVQTAHPLRNEWLDVSFRGERTTPALTFLFTASKTTTKAEICRETKRVQISAAHQQGSPENGEFRYQVPVEFEIPQGAPGTLCPLDTGSSSIRYYINAQSHTSPLSRPTICSKEVHIFRACRRDWTGLDSFEAQSGCFGDVLNYEVHSMKTVLCGGQARFHVVLKTLHERAAVQSLCVTLREKQTVRVMTPAAFQTRPGETMNLESWFELASRQIEVPTQSVSHTLQNDEHGSRSHNILFDLSLPESPAFYRRSSATRGGISLEHYFDLEFNMASGPRFLPATPFRLRCETSLALPIDFDNYAPHLERKHSVGKQIVVAPPPYDEFAPPNYDAHRIDPLYYGGKILENVAAEQEVAFL